MRENTEAVKLRRWVRRPFLALAMTALMAATAACGGIDRAPADDNLLGLVLDGANIVAVKNVASYLDAPKLPGILLRGRDETRQVQREYLDYWEDGQLREDMAIDLERVSTITNVYQDNGDGTYSGYRVFRGDLDLDAVAEDLEAGGFNEETYRDFPIWRQASGSTTLVLLREQGAYIVAHEREVRDILRAMDRKAGFLDGETALGRVLQAVGEGIWVVGFTGCREDHYLMPYRNLYDSEKEAGLLSSFPRLLTGCVANATAVTGGDEDTTEAVTAVVFTTPRRAEAGLEDLRGFMEDSDLIDIDIDDARVEDDMVVVELTVYE